jgi:hypothetical protein
MESEWRPIETVPKCGCVVRLRQGDLAPCHARWVNSAWQWIEFQHPTNPTHWAEASEEKGQTK